MTDSQLFSSQKNLKLPKKGEIPHIIKYMGSKRELLGFLVDSINEIYEGEPICDLFAGTSVLSGALGKQVPMRSNDIQEYSAILAHTYLGDYDWERYPKLVEDIVRLAQNHVDEVKNLYPDLVFDYSTSLSLNEFNALEQAQQELIYLYFEDVEHHLFIKNYSGTYWSFEQCLWIDALRKVALEYVNTPVYYSILASLMYAMAYNAQSTGHYAQYRDATNEASMGDIVIYRQRQILPYFIKKMEELKKRLGSNKHSHVISSMDYRDCLDSIEEGTLVYADPPYAFVHYSRFYHALETLVKYDFPDVSFKGRYRTDRHQSPFCKRTEVNEAFGELFTKIAEKNAKLVLSYSNTGMITLDQIVQIAKHRLGKKYTIQVKELAYLHSTMGRSDSRQNEVKEYLVIAEAKPLS